MVSVAIVSLNPLPYQNAIRDFLKAEDGRVWEWFASNKTGDDQAEAVRFDLLKTTYRVERGADPKLYAIVDEVAGALSLDVPVTIYQSQNPERLNAALAYVPHEAHVIFEGAIKSKLYEAEVRAVLGHELAHYSLWQGWNGEFLIVDQVLTALTHDEQAETAHLASARLFNLYNEIYCDRGALAVVGDPLIVVSMLVKIATGLDEVNAESYIRQAEEIFSKGPATTAGLTHPEAFIRARAVKLWHEGDEAVEDKIAEMIEGCPVLDDLDLLAQRRIDRLTRRLIDSLLSKSWIQSEPTVAHARLFYPDYSPPNDTFSDSNLVADLATNDQPLKDYYCFVLLDFATTDRELEELPLAAALDLSEQMGLKDRFVEIAKKEMRLTKKQLETIDQEKAAMLQRAATGK
jgi:hypothetical protein